MTKATSNRPPSPIVGCRIDFDRLCDNNDFRSLTNQYNQEATRELLCSITNLDLRMHVINAIRLQRQLEQEEDYLKQLEIYKEQAMLQKECAAVIDSVPDKEDSKSGHGFTAREYGVLAYYFCEAHGIYYTGEAKETDLEQVKNMLSAISGFSPTSFNNLCVPDFENNADRRAMNKVANTIKPVYPKISQKIFEDLDET